MKTFLDAGVLIAGWRGIPARQLRALTVLNDPRRQFLSSPFVELEVLPKAQWHKNTDEVDFYRSFFETAEMFEDYGQMVAEAKQLAERYGLAAMDALHVAGAVLIGADELVTAERLTSPLMRVKEIKVVTILR